jgi:hypothetical protein
MPVKIHVKTCQVSLVDTDSIICQWNRPIKNNEKTNQSASGELAYLPFLDGRFNYSLLKLIKSTAEP